MRSGAETILVIEEIMAIREALCWRLQQCGYDTELAESLPEAKELVEKSSGREYLAIVTNLEFLSADAAALLDLAKAVDCRFGAYIVFAGFRSQTLDIGQLKRLSKIVPTYVLSRPFDVDGMLKLLGFLREGETDTASKS